MSNIPKTERLDVNTWANIKDGDIIVKNMIMALKTNRCSASYYKVLKRLCLNGQPAVLLAHFDVLGHLQPLPGVYHFDGCGLEANVNGKIVHIMSSRPTALSSPLLLIDGSELNWKNRP